MYPGWSARDNYAIHKKRRKRKVKQVDSKGAEDSVEDSNKESESLIKNGRSPLTTPSVPSLNKASLSPLKTTPASNTDDEEIGVCQRPGIASHSNTFFFAIQI